MSNAELLLQYMSLYEVCLSPVTAAFAVVEGVADPLPSSAVVKVVDVTVVTAVVRTLHWFAFECTCNM